MQHKLAQLLREREIITNEINNLIGDINGVPVSGEW